MMIAGNDIHARLRRLRDRTERQLQDFLEILEAPEAAGRRTGRSGTARAGSARAGLATGKRSCSSAARPPQNATSTST